MIVLEMFLISSVDIKLWRHHYVYVYVYVYKNGESAMKRTSVMIPEDLKIRAAKRANAVGISLGEFIRESLEKALKTNPADVLDDPFLSDNAVFEGETPVDLALDHDKYLYENEL